MPNYNLKEYPQFHFNHFEFQSIATDKINIATEVKVTIDAKSVKLVERGITILSGSNPSLTDNTDK